MSDPSDESDGSQVNDPTDSNANDALQGQWTQNFGNETLRLTLTQDGHLRVERFPTTAGAYPDRGWTVAEDWQWPQGQLNFDDAGNAWVLETERWTLSVNKNNGLLSFDTDNGEMYRELNYQIDSPRLNVVLDDRDHFVALGEKTGGLDKRGEELTMWTTDAINPEEGILPWTDPIYQSHPFVITVRDGDAFGLYFQNTFRSVFDLGKNQSEVIISAEAGALDYVLIPGPTIPKVVERYTEMTGRTFMPPMWTMGYHQCKWSYHPDSQVESIANTFRELGYFRRWYVARYSLYGWLSKLYLEPN